MTENTNMSEVIEEIKGATEEDLKKFIEGWYEKTRTDGMKLGAQLIAFSIFSKMQKHLGKGGKPSLRDYERFTSDVRKIISVQMAESEVDNVTEEVAND